MTVTWPNPSWWCFYGHGIRSQAKTDPELVKPVWWLTQKMRGKREHFHFQDGNSTPLHPLLHNPQGMCAVRFRLLTESWILKPGSLRLRKVFSTPALWLQSTPLLYAHMETPTTFTQGICSVQVLRWEQMDLFMKLELGISPLCKQCATCLT